MRFTLVLMAITLSGCVFSSAVRVGPAQASKPPNCELQFADTAPEELAAKWIRVGSVCIASETGLDVKRAGDAHDELVAHACALGGEMVTPSSTCSVGRVDGTEFAVMRARSSGN